MVAREPIGPPPDPDSSASLSFTQQNQPTITVLSQSQNKIRVALNTTALVSFHATGSAITDDHLPVPPFTQFPDFNGSLSAKAEFQLAATADIALWPTVSVENVSVVLTNGQPHVEITGLQGDMTEFGLVVGSSIGFSPGGLLLGGPGVFSLIALIGTNEAHDAAVTAVRNAIAKGLEEAVKKANSEIKKQIEGFIAPAVASANQVQNAALNTSFPQVGMSLNQFMGMAGASRGVRTLQSGPGTRTTITVRFDGQPRGGKVTGKIRLPMTDCQQSTNNIGGVSITMGYLKELNQDLSAGMSCSAILGAGGMDERAFLGGTPPGTSLPNWLNTSGQLVGKGVVNAVITSANNGYYECSFEINGLPKGVVNFTSTGVLNGRLGDHKVWNERRWVLGLSQPWIIGGAGECKGNGVSGGLTLNKKAAMIEKIENCPECGPRFEMMNAQWAHRWR